MNITMTKAKALAIQAEQIEHYVGFYGEHVRKLVADATTADSLDDDVVYDIVTINRHIPRGGAIEHMIPEKRESEAACRERGRLARLRDRPRKGVY